MNLNEINGLLEDLFHIERTLEDTYVENGGEVTDETEKLEEEAKIVEKLLVEGGIDSLGRVIAKKQDEVKIIKAEAKSLTAQAKRIEAGVDDFFRPLIRRIIDRCGADVDNLGIGKVYKFKPDNQEKVECDMDAVKAMYYDKAVKAFRDAGIPEWLTPDFKASSTEAIRLEGELPMDFFKVNRKETVRFIKPRESNK